MKPLFLITIDTEGDNIWSSPTNVTTENAKYLPRFQSLCEEYGFKPTYVTNYEMAISREFVKFGKDILREKTGEIGMHLHAWNNPPIRALTENDYKYQPYLTEFPKEVMAEKIDLLTNLLEQTFETKMFSHRAGRWSFNATYARLLAERGYIVDCSVVPYVSYQAHKGDPTQNGGTDYTHFGNSAYFLDLNDISRPGSSTLLEVPLTVRVKRMALKSFLKKTIGFSYFGQKVHNKLCPTLRLRPNGINLEQMKVLISKVLSEGDSYVEFMLHSSEFMPGGSPTFRTVESIDKLYKDLQQLFEFAQGKFEGATLKDYYDFYIQ